MTVMNPAVFGGPVAVPDISRKPAQGRGAAAGVRCGSAAGRQFTLTRRGRVVVAALAVAGALALVAVAWLTGAATAQAASYGAPALSGAQHTASVVVLPGESLWSIALRVEPGADPRAVVQEIVSLNGLHGPVVQPGERLQVPGQ